MLEPVNSKLKRIEEYLSYLSNVYSNQYAALNDLSESLIKFLEDYRLLIRNRIDGIDVRNEFVVLTGRFADLIGVSDYSYTEEFSSELWVKFLQWIQALLSRGLTAKESEDTFSELFNMTFSISDQVDFRGIYNSLYDPSSQLSVNLQFDPTSEDYALDAIEDMLNVYTKLLPVYLDSVVTIFPDVIDYISIEEEITVATEYGVLDYLTVDFLKTGGLYVSIKDRGGIDVSGGTLEHLTSLRVEDFFKVIVPGTVEGILLEVGNILVSTVDKESGPVLADFQILTDGDLRPQSQPVTHEILDVIPFTFDSATTGVNESARTADILSIDPTALPAPVEQDLRSYFVVLEEADLQKDYSHPTITDLHINGNIYLYDIRP